MPTPRVLIRFFFTLLVIGAVLLARWPGVEPIYRKMFCTCGNLAFARFLIWPEGSVRFLDGYNPDPRDIPPGVKPPPMHGVTDTLLKLENRRTRTDFGFLRTSSRYVGYIPTAVMIALVLATPTTWRRRWIAMAWAIPLIHLFIFVRLSLLLATGYAGDKAYALFNPGPTALKILRGAETILQDDPTVSFVVPVALWFLLLFRPTLWSGHIEEKAVIAGEGAKQ